MARKPTAKAETALVNVFYEDGSQTSNRRIPGDLIGHYDRDAQILAFIEAQDREIGERSGRPRGAIDKIKLVR